MNTPPAFASGLRFVLLLALCLGALAGCGQKGDLYLPDDPQAQQFDPAP